MRGGVEGHADITLGQPRRRDEKSLNTGRIAEHPPESGDVPILRAPSVTGSGKPKPVSNPVRA